MRFRLLLVFALLAPTALAAWGPTAYTQEPSTPYDVDSYMWQEPNASPESRVYFDIRQVGATASNPLPHLEATLGVWRDCNGDGMMGGPTGSTYPAVLAFTGACPAGSRHNDGITVREVLAIGPGLAYPDYNDPAARVWADRGIIGAQATPTKTSVDTNLAWSAAEGQWVGTNAFVSPEATGYARIDPGFAAANGLSFPGHMMWTYGEPCYPNIGPGAPSQSGWSCDPTQWPAAPRVGDLYQLRDTDCITAC